VVASGLQGLAIRDELKRRRQQVLADWKLTQDIPLDQA
jgi:tRNA nucleotidyltransferase (CCA-adding enzyme)